LVKVLLYRSPGVQGGIIGPGTETLLGGGVEIRKKSTAGRKERKGGGQRIYSGRWRVLTKRNEKEPGTSKIAVNRETEETEVTATILVKPERGGAVRPDSEGVRKPRS